MDTVPARKDPVTQRHSFSEATSRLYRAEQSETLEWFYLPFEGECPDVILSVGVLMDLSLMFIAFFCRLRGQH